jgi:hypothetical protein
VLLAGDDLGAEGEGAVLPARLHPEVVCRPARRLDIS